MAISRTKSGSKTRGPYEVISYIIYLLFTYLLRCMLMLELFARAGYGDSRAGAKRLFFREIRKILFATGRETACELAKLITVYE
jgi:hypothetical protein